MSQHPHLELTRYDPAQVTPQQFMPIIKADMNKWGELIKQNKIAIE